MGCVTIHRRPERWAIRFQRDMPGNDTSQTARLVERLFRDIVGDALTPKETILTAFEHALTKVREAEAMPEVQLWGEQIRAAREAIGVSQEYLARVIGADHTTVSRWESNKAAPRAHDLSRIVRFFARLGVDFDPFDLDRKRLDLVDDAQGPEQQEDDDA
jgi:DNA-binding transcriptional regulator YiaG